MKIDKQTSRTKWTLDKGGAEYIGARTVFSVNGAGSVRWYHWGKIKFGHYLTAIYY